MSRIIGPHQRLAGDSRRDTFLAALLDRLWDRYRSRVPYVATYERLLAEAGATFHNDHIAFRTLGNQQPATGIQTLSRIFEALGYRAAGVYQFADKHLSAIHYQHPRAEFPKLFISELKSWELPADCREIIARSLASHRPPVAGETLSQLDTLDKERRSRDQEQTMLDGLCDQFWSLPWAHPIAEDVQRLNQASQYAAWVLVHGYQVNHFTALVNSHGVDALRDLDRTVAALRGAGVPMKSEIEGQPGSKLRQTATEAVMCDVQVRRGGAVEAMPWSYAYFELAERNPFLDHATGQQVRFEGFLGDQATNLFEMTRVR
jgi:hypothetical protein